MNSLTYLSRQIDSRSSSQLSLSQGNNPVGRDELTRPQLTRSKTWSKPFFFRKRLRKPVFRVHDSDEDSDESIGRASGSADGSGGPSNARLRKRRSLSSPALFLEREPNTVGSGSTITINAPLVLTNGKTPPISKAHIDLTPSPFLTTSPSHIFKESFLYNHFRNTVVIRALAAVWNCLCVTYDTLFGTRTWTTAGSPKRLHGRRRSGGVTISEDEMDTTTTENERESDDDGVLMINPVTRASVNDGSTSPPLELVAPSISVTGTPPRSLTPNSSPLSTPTPTSTPPPPSSLRRQTPFHLPKTLVLDLDETLIHSTARPMYRDSGGSLFGFEFGGKRIGKGHPIEVILNGRRTLYHVYKRPFVDYFLRKVSTWYTLVIFTASMQEYADPVIDWLDAGKGVLRHRLFRDSCTQLPNGSYTKDLSLVEDDLSRVCLVDNSPICYSGNPANGIPIEGWTHDLSDEALLDLLPVLDSLRFTSDVRRVLGLRGFT